MSCHATEHAVVALSVRQVVGRWAGGRPDTRSAQLRVRYRCLLLHVLLLLPPPLLLLTYLPVFVDARACVDAHNLAMLMHGIGKLIDLIKQEEQSCQHQCQCTSSKLACKA